MSEEAKSVAECVRTAKALLGEHHYLTLATADESGRPWASTVWFCASLGASSSDRLAVELIWLSRPQAQHSVNLEGRPDVGVSVFDSTQLADSGVGLQFAARAERVPDDEVGDAIAAFSRASVAVGGESWSKAQVEGSAPLRVYRARPLRAYLLGDGSRIELPVSPMESAPAT